MVVFHVDRCQGGRSQLRWGRRKPVLMQQRQLARLDYEYERDGAAGLWLNSIEAADAGARMISGLPVQKTL
jgi:hypothetical protein